MRQEEHRTTSTGWLRAAVLGANDGLISTASLVAGVAAAGSGRHAVLLAGVAGLIAGAMSMAAGEYVSVSSQADSENADLARERRELATDPVGERAELTGIYTPESRIVWVVTSSALLLLVVLGALAARIGGAKIVRGALRVAFWGAMAMAFSTFVGRAFETRT
jgi:VIT1/CCC1 family predicted Fe2+/Mn2+ transporter